VGWGSRASSFSQAGQGVEMMAEKCVDPGYELKFRKNRYDFKKEDKGTFF
jgi:hypothetical protein